VDPIQTQLDIRILSRSGRRTAGSQIDDSAKSNLVINYKQATVTKTFVKELINMLKIWLTCLQPSLGILGVVLVLSNTVSAFAASKTAAIMPNKVSKGQPQQKVAKPLAQPQQFGTKGAGVLTASTPAQSGRVISSASPDDAVRRLALDTIANSDRKTPTVATKTSQPNNSGIASFITPSPLEFNSVRAKATNAKPVQQPVVATTHRPIAPATSLGAELFIGNSNNSTFDRPIGNFPNLAVPSSQAILPVVARSLPTATMTAATKVTEPLAVLPSEQIKPLGSTAVVNQTAPQSNPLATNVSKGLEQFLGNEPKSIQADAAPETTVAKGLEQFLGNEPKSIQADAMAPVATAIPVKTDSILPLSELLSPTKAAPRTANASGLQLATSKSYDSSADFDLPGVATQVSTVKTAQTKVQVLAVKTNNRSTAVVSRKNDYATLASSKILKSEQSWATVSQRNSLGGLILGSRSSIDDAQASTNEVAALPMNVLKANTDSGLGLFDPMNQY
jgi:hypothetical protein